MKDDLWSYKFYYLISFNNSLSCYGNSIKSKNVLDIKSTLLIIALKYFCI